MVPPGHGAPMRIHSTTALMSSSASRPAGGISTGSPRNRFTKLLWSGFSMEIAAPESPPLRIPSRLSSFSPANGASTCELWQE